MQGWGDPFLPYLRPLIPTMPPRKASEQPDKVAHKVRREMGATTADSSLLPFTISSFTRFSPHTGPLHGGHHTDWTVSRSFLLQKRSTMYVKLLWVLKTMCSTPRSADVSHMVGDIEGWLLWSKLVSLEGQALVQTALPFRPYDTLDTVGWRHWQWGNVQVIFMESPSGRMTTYDPQILEP